MTEADRLRIVAHSLSRLRFSSKEVTGPIGYMVGATYALGQAHALYYCHGDIDDAAYKRELQQVADALANNLSLTEVEGLRLVGSSFSSFKGMWLAGFYFNCALHCIAAAAERLGAHPKKGPSAETVALRKIREDVNKLKHEIKGLLSRRETKSVGAALDALEHLVQACRASKIF